MPAAGAASPSGKSSLGGRYTIACWEEAVAELDVRRRIPPRLQNTEQESAWAGAARLFA
ncbi:MAG: hypothetical protein GWO02_00735 [Gammaproteobacteria bacterium]|nr:hypothetical protein [Gammaproteobacteria bacterium]